MASKKTASSTAEPKTPKTAAKAAAPKKPAAPKKAAAAAAPPTREAIAKLAEQYWIERGRPEGSPEVDWQRAEQELNSSKG